MIELLYMGVCGYVIFKQADSDMSPTQKTFSVLAMVMVGMIIVSSMK